MVEITVKIDGMMCAMCASHVNDALRNALAVKKITTSHQKGECVFVSETPPPEEAIRTAIEKNGYRVLAITVKPYEKKGLFSRFFR